MAKRDKADKEIIRAGISKIVDEYVNLLFQEQKLKDKKRMGAFIYKKACEKYLRSEREGNSFLKQLKIYIAERTKELYESKHRERLYYYG